jgi:hypothetical protein
MTKDSDSVNSRVEMIQKLERHHLNMPLHSHFPSVRSNMMQNLLRQVPTLTGVHASSFFRDTFVSKR